MLINWQGLHPIYYQCHSCYHSYIVNYRKFSWVINFANFVNFQPFQKIFTWKFWICDKVFTFWRQEYWWKLPQPGLAAESTKNSLQGDTFKVVTALLTAVSSSRRQCKSEHYINQPGLYWICELFSMKSSKLFFTKKFRTSKIKLNPTR